MCKVFEDRFVLSLHAYVVRTSITLQHKLYTVYSLCKLTATQILVSNKNTLLKR